MGETSEHLRACEVALAALYLRDGDPGRFVERRRWRAVMASILRREATIGKIADSLRRDRFQDEAIVAETPNLLARSEELVDSGRCLTAAGAGYPSRWLQRLGTGAPPAMWQLLDPDSPASDGRLCLSAVGSRRITKEMSEFAFSTGAIAATAGFCLVSGNAIGSDEGAMRGAAKMGCPVIGILPHGLNRLERRLPGVHYWTLCPANEEFSTASAMERNALIYAASTHSVVVHARLREGGTWHGAVEAHRRKLTRIVVREDSESAGNRALIALGGIAVKDSTDLLDALAAAGPQPILFD